MMVLAVGPSCEAAQPPGKAVTRTVMLFPVATKPAQGGDRCAADLFLLIKEQLASQTGVRVVAYDMKNVSVQRLIREQRLDEKTANQFEADATGEAKAYRICAEMGIGAAVLTSLSKYRYDPGVPSVEVSIKLECLDIAAQTPTKTVQAAGIGKVDPEAGGARTEEALCIQALSDLMGKLFGGTEGVGPADLNVTMVEQAQVMPLEPKKKGSLLPAMLGALLLGLLLSGGG